jgi:hypothetical protein
VAKWVPGFNTIVLQGAKEDRVSVTGRKVPTALLPIDRHITFTTGRDDQGAYHDVRLRCLDHVVRDVSSGEIGPAAIRVGVHHHRRGAPNQERRLAPESDRQELLQSRSTLDHWNALAKQLAGALGAVELHSAW